MPASDSLTERLVPLVEWVVFRFWRIVAATIACGLCLLFLLQAWGRLSTRGQAPLRGRVSVEGRPVTFGVVTVVTAAGTTLTGRIRPDGTYELPQVPPGAVRIGVSSPEPRTVFQKATSSPESEAAGGRGAARPAQAGGSGAAGGGLPRSPAGGVTIAVRVDAPPPSTQAAVRPEHAGWFRIPGRYADPVRSGLGGSVAAAGSTIDIDLPAADGER